MKRQESAWGILVPSRRMEIKYPTSLPTPLLSIVMPCYNESETIENTIKEWTEYLVENIPAFEMIVINDGSTDGTGRILDKLRKEIRQLRVIHQLNNGHGRAIRRGYELSRGQHVLQLDSNGRYELSDFLQLWKERGNADLILAHRTHRLDGFFRRGFAIGIKRAAKTLFSVTLADPNVPFRLFQREIAMPYLSGLPAQWDSVNLAMAVLMKKETPERVLEVRVPFRLRPKGITRVGLSTFLSLGVHYLIELFKLRVRSRVLRLTHGISYLAKNPSPSST